MAKKPSIVVVGGGTGTHTVLQGLKRYSDSVDLSAVVAMTDSGGSTGRLRDEFGYLPVGDVRMALAALANEEGEGLLRRLFLHRFATEGDIAGHNFGNLFLVALTDMLGSEERAIEAAARILRVCGNVYPVTHEKVDLVARYDDGAVVVGEHEIDEPKGHSPSRVITGLSLTPVAKIHEGAHHAIRNADVVVFGPGDLFTSVLANCVVQGFAEALSHTNGTIVYIANLMTKSGQTHGMGVSAHLHTLARYAGRMPHKVIVNTAPLPAHLLARYREENEYPVALDYEGNSCEVIAGNFLATEEIVKPTGDVLRRSLIRHDSEALADAIMNLVPSL